LLSNAVSWLDRDDCDDNSSPLRIAYRSPQPAARRAEEHELRPKQPCRRGDQPSLGCLLGYVAATGVPTLIEALQMGLSLYDRYGSFDVPATGPLQRDCAAEAAHKAAPTTLAAL
jgi:hypothetical protein